MSTWEEYKFSAESTQYLLERRQNATQMYIGVNTAICKRKAKGTVKTPSTFYGAFPLPLR